MANTRFNHSYWHCKSTDCELKGDCAHHLAYLEAVELGIKDFKTFEHCENLELGYVRVRIEKS